MNPYGTTRQDVGGENYRYEPRRSRWYDIVPFRPCKPPLPRWIVDWPLESAREEARLVQPFIPCAGPDETLLGDARTGTLPTPPGPLLSGQSFPASGINNTNIRVWAGRVRGFGAGLRCVAVSPSYSGPALIKHIEVFGSLNNGGGAVLRDSFGIGIGSAQPAVDVPVASTVVNGFTIYDSSVSSDQTNEQLGTGPANLNFLSPVDPAAVNVHQTLPLNMLITQSAFQVWIVLDTRAAGASYAMCMVVVELMGQGSPQQGISQSYFSPPWNQAAGYIGLPGVVG